MNERREAEKILETGDLGVNEYSSISLLARYYYHVQGMKRMQIIKKLNQILPQIMPGYEPKRMAGFIDKVATRARGKPLTEIEAIHVTKKEIEKINELPSIRLQRLMFTMCVFARYFDTKKETNNHWVNIDPWDLYSAAKVNVAVNVQADMYRSLIDRGYIKYSKKIGNNNCQVLILDNSVPEVYVTDFRNIGYTYMKYTGGDYIECERCGLMYRRIKGERKPHYCKSCREKLPVSMRRYNCIDCGAEVFVMGSNHKSCRCAKCQSEANLLRYKKYKERKQTQEPQIQMQAN